MRRREQSIVLSHCYFDLTKQMGWKQFQKKNKWAETERVGPHIRATRAAQIQFQKPKKLFLTKSIWRFSQTRRVATSFPTSFAPFSSIPFRSYLRTESGPNSPAIYLRHHHCKSSLSLSLSSFFPTLSRSSLLTHHVRDVRRRMRLRAHLAYLQTISRNLMRSETELRDYRP